MKYGLIVQLGKETYEVKGYSKIAGFEHINEEKLKSIVEFTNNFEHEQELISYLIDEGLLPKKFFKGDAHINYYKGKNTQPKTLQYGISFMEDKKYFDTIFLKHYYCNKLNNPRFMKSFLNKYYTYLKDIGVFREQICYINYCYDYYFKNEMLPNGAYDAMTKFIEIYCSKKSKDGFYKADFTRIRDLAMFAINYERENIRIPIERPEHTIEEIEPIIGHFNELIQNDTLTEEETEAYENAINKLEKELEYTRKVTRNRSLKHDITKN